MDIKAKVANEYEDLKVEGFDEENAKELTKILRRFLSSYSNKDKETSDKDWLKQELKKELPDLSNDEAEEFSVECIEEVKSIALIIILNPKIPHFVIPIRRNTVNTGKK